MILVVIGKNIRGFHVEVPDQETNEGQRPVPLETV